jgi:hypothetical protein
MTSRENGEGRPQTLRAWFGRVADHARDLMRERVEDMARQAARILHEEFEQQATRMLHGEFESVLEQAEARLRRLAIFAGLIVAGAGLIVVGLAGAAGEWLGRAWLGQLAVGAILAVGAVVWRGLANSAAKRRAAEEALRAALAAAAHDAEQPSVASAGKAGWLAGRALAKQREAREN